MSFQETYGHYNWEAVETEIYEKQERDVKLAISKDRISLHDFMALLSPAANPLLEAMSSRSRHLTQKRFGNTIQMYIPLYLSNECQNICTYCGFSQDNNIVRKTLTESQILEEVAIIKEYGYDHVLLVAGEANRTVGIDYFEKVLKLIRPYFSHISLEVQPLVQEEYERLISLGLNTVLVYQETYNQGTYKLHHPKGKKSIPKNPFFPTMINPRSQWPVLMPLTASNIGEARTRHYQVTYSLKTTNKIETGTWQ